MMKKALIGLSNNILTNINKIKVWSKSFKQYSDGDIILLCANTNKLEMDLCKSLGIITVPVLVNDINYINHKRLLITKEVLETYKYDVCIITDVFDVVFQSDPFKKLDFENFDIFVSGEGVNVNQEPWNSDNINKLFPQHFNACVNTEIINSGVIAGKRLSLIKLLDMMYNLCQESNNNHNIKDQAALIVLVSLNLIPNLKIFNLDDGWAMHCAVAGPTQFFDAWGFRNNLKYGIPQLINKTICTKTGDVFDIVHQFNRIDKWNEILTNEYI
jgi:hypothetical protein